MGLRARVALLLAAAIIPISLGFSAWRIAAEHRSMTERRADRFVSRLQRLEGRCPDLSRFDRFERRRGPRPSFRPHFYSASFVPYDDAPKFPDDLRSVVSSEDPIHVWRIPGADDLGVTAMQIADSGKCAIVVIPWRHEEIPPGAIRSAVLQTFGLALALAVLGMLVSLPIVRRIRRLEDAVRRARTQEFDLDLGGNDEITALAAAFGDTLSAVREREHALEEYIANTTHDLAIPLTVLQHRLRKIAEERPSDDINVALEESHYISGLIANMRTAAKLEAGAALDLSHDVDLAQIVERVAQRHLPIAAQKRIELNYAVTENAAIVTGEPTLVEQALSNLVQNAVQYNDEGGHVSVMLEQIGRGFELIVADDGPGIPPEKRELVMQRGVRDDSARTRNETGQGFGLAIVRRVAELHGWTLTLEGEEGLVVRLEIQPSNASSSATSS